MNDRHAYLILAHTEFELLQILVSCLDDDRNDIFVHIDKKIHTLPSIQTKKAGLVILQERVDVRWGDISVIEAEFELFETAIKKGPYQYYHLLSGVDLPIKSQDYIHQFFNEHDGEEFIAFSQLSITPEIVRKVQRWHLFPKDFRSRSLLKRGIRAAFIRIQELAGIKRNKEINFKKGSQWVSITDGMARLFVSHKEWASDIFLNTFCCDEIVMQTLCWESPFRAKIHCYTDGGKGNMRAIHWENGQLIDWSAADIEYLKTSTALFARKFNLKDRAFIKEIANGL